MSEFAEHHTMWMNARHEAAHAVMAFILQHDIDEVMITKYVDEDGDDAVKGHVLHRTYPNASCIDKMFVKFAGMIAQDWIGYNSGEYKSDLEGLGELTTKWFKDIGGPVDTSEGNRWINAVAASAEVLLKAFRPWIDAVAKELCKRKTLTGAEVKAIIAQCQNVEEA
jgi:hypothetical protein